MIKIQKKKKYFFFITDKNAKMDGLNYIYLPNPNPYFPNPQSIHIPRADQEGVTGGPDPPPPPGKSRGIGFHRNKH